MQTMEKASGLCTTCGASVLGGEATVHFKCPNCAKTSFTRCMSCRVLKNKYACKECGFTGP